MASYGSAANPVVLDPFRRIVEVGWGARYLACSLAISMSADFGGGKSSEPGVEFVEPWTYQSLESVTLTYPGGSAVSSPKVYSGGGWRDASEATASNEPTLPGPTTFTLWDYAFLSSVVLPMLPSPNMRFVDGDGSPLDINAPAGGGKFLDALSPSVKIFATPFTGEGPFPGTIRDFEDRGNLWKTYLGGVENQIEADSAPLSLSGMTMTWREKSYHAIGSKVVSDTSLWVLFGRTTS